MPVFSSESASTEGFLTVELLRPEAWVRDRVRLFTNAQVHWPVPNHSLLDSVAFAPLRGIYLDLIRQRSELSTLGPEAHAILIDLDLPEMGAIGCALVIDIEGYVHVPDGPGDVVTATFVHPATCEVLEVVFGSDDPTTADETLSVTESHPFWNVEFNEFTAVGQMKVGQRVLTYSGQTKRIVSKLARPGPHTVYNLEVYGQHVYCVGHSGFLVHNDCLSDNSWEDTPRDRAVFSGSDARQNGLSPVSTRSALMTGRQLSISEVHHIASPYRSALRNLFKSLGRKHTYA